MRVEYRSPAATASVAARGAGWSRLPRVVGILRPGTTAVATRSAPPWWLCPHLLSLDAPLVALAWQEWWHRVGGTPLSVCERVILGLGVWLIYLADRVADTARVLPDDPRTARHGFAEVRRVPLVILIAVIAAGLVVLAPCTLATAQFRGGLVLLAAAGIYFWLIHRRGSQSWMARLPKEAAVGGLFTLGTAFFALCRSSLPTWPLLTAIALFGVVCFLNCALITIWERNACDLRDPYSFLNAFPRLAAHGLRPTCWLLAALAGGVGLASHAWVLMPVAVAACALGILDRWQHRVSPDALRTLADAVLLTPWLCCGVSAVASSLFH